VTKSSNRLRIGVPIGAPRTELQRARERTERRRAPHVRRGARGEELAVDEDEIEVRAARGLHLYLRAVVVRRRVRVVGAREGVQEGAGGRGGRGRGCRCCRARRVGGI